MSARRKRKVFLGPRKKVGLSAMRKVRELEEGEGVMVAATTFGGLPPARHSDKAQRVHPHLLT